MKKTLMIMTAAAVVCLAASVFAAARENAPEPKSGEKQSEPKPYLIQPEDVLEVTVWEYPMLTMKINVRPDGMIAYPFLGEYHAAGATVKDVTAAILKSFESTAPATGPYKIEAKDTLDITVWSYPDLTMKITVPPDGKISYPFLGIYAVAGKTSADLIAAIKSGLNDYLKNPIVSVNVTSANYIKDPKISVNVLNIKRMRAFVLGAVLHPGMSEIRQGDNVLDLITSAGGFAPNAKTSKVALIHPPKNPGDLALLANEIPGNKNDSKAAAGDKIPENVVLIDVADILGVGQFPLTKDYELGDGDIIYVPTGKKVDWTKLSNLITIIYTTFRIDDLIK
jgi:protein involved in polysaccharide export with SLBB domain